MANCDVGKRCAFHLFDAFQNFFAIICVYCRRRNIIILAQVKYQNTHCFTWTNDCHGNDSQFRFSFFLLFLVAIYFYIDRIELRWPSTFIRKIQRILIVESFIRIVRMVNAIWPITIYAINLDEFRWKTCFSSFFFFVDK